MQVTNNVSYVMSSYRNAIGALSLSLRLCTLTWHANKFKLTIDVDNQIRGQTKSNPEIKIWDEIKSGDRTERSPVLLCHPLQFSLRETSPHSRPTKTFLPRLAFAFRANRPRRSEATTRDGLWASGRERQSRDARGAKRRPQPGDGARRPASPTNAGKEKGRP